MSKASRVQRGLALALSLIGAGLVALFAGAEILKIGYPGLGALQLTAISIGLTFIACAHVLVSRRARSFAVADLPWMLGIASMLLTAGAVWVGYGGIPPEWPGGDGDELAERLLALERSVHAPRQTAAQCLPPEEGRSPRVALEPIVEGLRKPVYVTTAGDGSGRLFVVEKGGSIQIAGSDGLEPVPFLDIRDRVMSDDDSPPVSWEQGLLSVAFPPDYAQTGYFYVHYTAVPDGTVTISRFVVTEDPNVADPSSETVVLAVPTVGPDHNGGQLQFGPDGYLFVSIGDGNGFRWPHGNPKIYGDGAVRLAAGDIVVPPDRGYTEDDVEKDDPWNQSQDLSTLRGKILRLDVSRGTGYTIPDDNPFMADDDRTTRGEIWAYGLRNPWRFSFDGCDGSLYVGDVGRSQFEEVNLVRPGRNYGWKIMEGSYCYPPYKAQTCSITGLEFPIAEYGHLERDPSGGNAIIGGYVYRGDRIPSLVGRYVFGDFMSGHIWTLTASGRSASGWKREKLLTADFLPASFGLDAEGEILVLEYGGRVHRLVPRPPAGTVTAVNP